MADDIKPTKKVAKKKTTKKSPVTKKATVSKKVVKKAASKKTAAKKTVAKKTVVSSRPAAAAKPAIARVSPEERIKMIEEAAYYRAEKRGFAPGYEAQDWDDSEKEIDAMLKREGRL